MAIMATKKKREIVRWYRLDGNHRRILIREEIREVKGRECHQRRITEREDPASDIPEINLNQIAAQLPPELEGQWIVELVRNYGRCRGVRNDAALRDDFNEAVAAAVKAAKAARTEGGDLTAYVKQAVHNRLCDLQRQNDYRDARLENDDTKVSMRNPHTDFRCALRLLSPRALDAWHRYRRNRGNLSAIARELGISEYKAETHCLKPLKDEMREALAWVKAVRGKTL